MKITTEDVLQSKESEFGYQVEVSTDEGEVRINVAGVFTKAEALAIAKALKTLAGLA